MKIPFRPIFEAEYERQLSALVARFEADCAAATIDAGFSNIDPNSRYVRIWKALREHGPMTAREACEKAGVEIIWTRGNPAKSPQYGVILENLEDRGWVEKYDRVEKVWIGGRGGKTVQRHKVWRFRALEDSSRAVQHRRETLTMAFLRATERLEARRMVGVCLTARVTTNANYGDLRYGRAQAGRNAEIVQRRLNGEVLGDVAKDYGITRERARQIVQRAAFKAAPKPKPPRIAKCIPVPTHIRVALREISDRQEMSAFSRSFGLNRFTLIKIMDGCSATAQRRILDPLEVAIAAWNTSDAILVQDSWWLTDGFTL